MYNINEVVTAFSSSRAALKSLDEECVVKGGDCSEMWLAELSRVLRGEGRREARGCSDLHTRFTIFLTRVIKSDF